MEFDSVLVFAFGNRILDDGSLLPGPINEELARVTKDVVATREVPVYAQWETADLLIADGLRNVVSVTPEEDADGNVVYLSTDGVARKAARLATSEGITLGRVAVIGHRDHVERCRRTSAIAGLEVVPISDDIMPIFYDPESGQEWTRTREMYLKADAYAMRLLTES